MLIVHVILAVLSAGAVARWPSRNRSAVVVAAAAAVAAALGAPVAPALALAAPLVAFLAAALTLAALAERSGLAERAAAALAAAARGNTLVLYALVCAICALLTAAVSLDGAVVLMVPLLLTLSRRWSVPVAPLFLGVVAVANVASIAVPQGNPTNLVVIAQLGISPAAFTATMLVPGVVAAALCAAAVAVCQRHALAGRYAPRTTARAAGAWSAAERHAALALAFAAAAAWAAPLAGVAPWWPFTGAVVLAHAARRERPRLVVPWRLAGQVAGLLVILGALAIGAPSGLPLGLPGLLGVAVAVGAASALANNLPVSVWAASLLAGPAAYAASIGLAAGALATRHGSVATLIAGELAGTDAPVLESRLLAPLALTAVLAATIVAWAL